MRASNANVPVIVGSSTTNGRIYWAKLEQLDAGGNVVATLWKFDPNERTGTGTTYTDPRGRVWTLTNANAIVPGVAAIPVEPAVKAQIVSYSYAHWRPEDIPPGQTTVPPLDAENDQGWEMRNLMSLLRPVSGFPYGTYNGSSWSDPSLDAVGVPGPWCVDTMSAVLPDLVIEEQGHTTTDYTTSGVRTPLYDTVFRLNLRDGLWYERGASGNIPLTWDDVNQVWVPTYAPNEWPDSGVGSSDLAPPDPSMMSLSLTGSAVSFSWTEDANYFDFQHQFTVELQVQLADYTKLQTLVSKWGASGRSWRFGIQADGHLFLDLSYDGTATAVTLVSSVIPMFEDGVSYSLAFSYNVALDLTTTPDNQGYLDEVRFWLLDQDDVWNLIGTPVSASNNTNAAVFNSTTRVLVGGDSFDDSNGAHNNTEGLFRYVSIRSGVGGDNTLGGIEVALMRGDLTNNPSYDRYGNLWVNDDDWSYEEMT